MAIYDASSMAKQHCAYARNAGTLDEKKSRILLRTRLGPIQYHGMFGS